MSIQVRLTPSGAIPVPPEVLKRLGIAEGEMVTLEETAEGLVIRTNAQGLERARALTRRWLKGDSVDAFLVDRKDWQE